MTFFPSCVTILFELRYPTFWATVVVTSSVKATPASHSDGVPGLTVLRDHGLVLTQMLLSSKSSWWTKAASPRFLRLGSLGLQLISLALPTKHLLHTPLDLSFYTHCYCNDSFGTVMAQKLPSDFVWGYATGVCFVLSGLLWFAYSPARSPYSKLSN